MGETSQRTSPASSPEPGSLLEMAAASLPRLPFVEGNEFLALSFPPIRFIVPHLVPAGCLVFFAGAPESYKTFFAFAMATRLGGGRKLFDLQDCADLTFCEPLPRANVGIVEEEMNPAFSQARFRKLYGAEVPAPGSLFVSHASGLQLSDDAWLDELAAQVKERKLDVVVIDPFVSAMGVRDENENAEISRILSSVRRKLIDDPSMNVSVIFIHHPAKNAHGGAGAFLRGAGEILGKADVAVLFEKDEYEPEAVVSVFKSRVEDRSRIPRYRVRFQDEGVKINVILMDADHDKRPKEEKQKAEKKDEMVEKIVSSFPPYGISKQEMAEKVGVRRDNDTFRRAWDSLVESGRVTQVDKYWRLDHVAAPPVDGMDD